MWNFIRIAARGHIGSGIISKNIGRSKGWVARLDTKNPLCVWPKHRPAENQIDSVCYIYVKQFKVLAGLLTCLVESEVENSNICIFLWNIEVAKPANSTELKSNRKRCPMDTLSHRKRTRTNAHADMAQTCGQEAGEKETNNLMMSYANWLTQWCDQDTQR